MKKLLLFFCLALMVLSCKNPNEEGKPSGMYVEKSPVENRTKMDFTSTNHVRVYFGDGTDREYTYSNSENIMTFTPVNVSQYPATNLYYHYKDPNHFELGSIYDGEKSVMQFETPNN